MLLLDTGENHLSDRPTATPCSSSSSEILVVVAHGAIAVVSVKPEQGPTPSPRTFVREALRVGGEPVHPDRAGRRKLSRFDVSVTLQSTVDIVVIDAGALELEQRGLSDSVGLVADDLTRLTDGVVSLAI